MDNKGFGLVTALGIFLIATVLIASLLTFSSYQARRAVSVMVEDQIELTAQNAIDMVAYVIEQSDDPVDDGFIPDSVGEIITGINYTFESGNSSSDLAVDNTYGVVEPISIERTEENVAIIYVTVTKGSLTYDLQGVIVASGFSAFGLDWGFQNYAK